MAFFRQTQYETKVWATVIATLFSSSEKDFHKAVIKQYPGVKDVLRKGYEEQSNTYELGIQIAVAVQARIIEELPFDDRRVKIAKQLRIWCRDLDSLQKFGANPKAGLEIPNADALLWRIQWGIWYISRLFEDGKIDEYYLRYFVSEMTGALEGRSSEERSSQRMVNMIDDAFGESE